LISVSSFFLYNSAVSRRMSEFSEEEEEKPVPQPHSPQMQAQMWGRVEKPSFKPPQEITTSTLPATEMYDLLDENQSPSEEIRIPVELEDSLLGELQSISEQNNQELPAGTTIRKGCSKCSKTFEITLPEGLETVYTNCPHCGSEEMVEIR